MAGIKDVIDTLDGAASEFEKVVDKSQTEIYKEVVALVKTLELDEKNHVKQTIANLQKLTAIKSKLGKIANNDKYLAGVGKLLKYFDVLQSQQSAYFSSNFPAATLGENAQKRHALMKQIAVQNTIQALTDDGLKAGVTDKLNDILLRAVTTNEKFGDLQEELRAHLLGKDGGQGALARHANTYAVTAISQFTGQNNKLLTEDLGCKWFMYVGSNIETTREFCQHLSKKRYIHISEIPDILKGKIDEHQCVIYKKTGLPMGMIEGTNADNFQVNCGGWNCRHQLVPVDALAVPAEIRAKFPEEGGPTKMQPIPEENYKADLDTFTDYLSKHKSGKVALNIEEMKKAAADGDQAKLDAIIAEAKATIVKNEASIKQKQEKAKLVKAHGELSVIMSKYSGHKVISADEIAQLMKDGSVEDIEKYVSDVESNVSQIMACTNIKDPMFAADEMSIEDLVSLNKKIGEFKSKFGSASDTGKIALVKTNIAAVDKSTPDGKIMFEALQEAHAELAQLKIAQDTKQKVDDIKAYSIAHPKSGKIAGLVKEAEEAIAVGDYDLANKKANEAQKIAEVNDASVKQKAAKKAADKATKSAAIYKWIKPSADDLDNFTPEQLKAADDSVEAKMVAWKGSVPYGYTEEQWLKKKLTYEIGFLESNKKYPTWKLVQAVYTSELSKIQQKENNANAKKVVQVELNNMQKMLQTIIYEDKTKLEDMFADIYHKFITTDDDLKKDIDKFKVEYTKLLAKENKRKQKEEEKAEKERDKALAKVLKSSKLNIELRDDEFFAAAQRTIDSGKFVGSIPQKELVEARNELKDAVASKDKKAAIEALKKLGYNPEDNLGRWRQDSAVWYKGSDAQKKTDDVLRDTCSNVWLSASNIQRDAAWGYTNGSSYLNEPLRGMFYSGYKDPKTIQPHCDALTKMIQSSVYHFDKWVQRGESIGATNSRFGISLNDYKPKDENGNVVSGMANDLVGKRGIEHGFTSTGSAGGNGFHGDVILNIFCPAGTQALYCEPFSDYGAGGKRGWDGLSKQSRFGGEFETLLQRETEYVITKAEYKKTSSYSGVWFIDLFVVSQKPKSVDLSKYHK